MSKWKVGIVGYGAAARAHIEAVNAIEDAEVAAVVSSRSQDADELSRRHGSSITCYTDLDSLLAESGVDVVSICSYHKDHARQAVATAQAGKHLIIEKPLALTVEDCRAVSEAVETSGVQVCVCFECRYSSQFLATRAVLDQGLLGSLHYGEVDYYHGIGPWIRQFEWNIKKDWGGSSLLTAGCHALDGLLLFLGSDVEEVSSYWTSSSNEDFARYEYATSSVTILKFASGRIGKVASVIDCLQPYYFHVHLVGSEGSLLDDKFHSNLLRGLDKGEWSRLHMNMLDSGDVMDHPYETQFRAFFDSLARGEPIPLTSLDDAVRTHEVIFAADRSAELGRPVRLSEIEQPS